ncbi:MAG: FecR domain-containing protein [Spirochaetia bacterium]|nr:FecR domain-containing protein [Spirochaetia bacterium]
MKIYFKEMLMAASLVAAPLFAYESSVKIASGTVEVLKDGKVVRKAATGEALTPGESVRTGKNSTAIVLLDGGTMIKLKESSEIRLTDLSGSAAEGNRKTMLNLLSGSVFSKVAKLKQNEDFAITSASTVAGVRGTSFFMAFGKARDNKKEADLWLCVNEGRVEVKGEKGDKVSVKEGEGIIIPEGKKTTKPKAYAWTKNLNWNFDPEKGEVSDKTTMESMYKEPLEIHYD